MFQRSLTFVAVSIMIAISGCVNRKINDLQPHVKLSTKSVTFNIFIENDFSDARWSDTKVQIKLAVSRIKQNPYQQKTEFDTTYAWIEVKDIPEAMRKI